MIKLVACDLDGTLLNSKHEISKENLQTVKKMQAKEIPFIIATGRIYTAALAYAQKLKLKTPIIACNGAVIKDPVKNEILFHYPISKETVYKLIEIGHRHKILFYFYSLDKIYTEKDNPIIKQYEEMNAGVLSKNVVEINVVEDLNSIVRDNTMYKLGLRTDESQAKEAVEEMRALKGITVCYSMSTLADVFNEKASKGQALKDLASLYHLDLSQVMALGDNENDISMLEAAGLGVAMAQANDFVKQAAKVVGLSNEENGVSIAIEKYLYL